MGLISCHRINSSLTMQNQAEKENLKRKRILLLIILALLIPAGILVKLYGGALFSNKFAGLLYVVFWILAAATVFPKASPLLLSCAVLIICCGLEFLQLLEHPVLESIRSTFIGRSLIGNSFSWMDMVYYGIGAVLSWGWLRKVDGSYIGSRTY